MATGDTTAKESMSGDQVGALLRGILHALERWEPAQQALSAPQPDPRQALIQLQYSVLSGLQGRPGSAPPVIPAARVGDLIKLTNVAHDARILRFSTTSGVLEVRVSDLGQDGDDLIVGPVPPEDDVLGFEAYDAAGRPIQLGVPLPAVQPASAKTRHR